MTSEERVFTTRCKMFELYDRKEHTVVKICMLFGISRTWFYTLKKRRAESGDEGLAPMPKKSTPPANRTPLEDELVVLDFIQQFPTYGPQRVSDELRQRSLLNIGHTAVYGIMRRNGLNTKQKRLEWVRKLSGEVVKLSDLQRDRELSKSRHIEASYPGFLVGIDIFYVGCLKNLGRVYQITACDCFSSFGWAKVYLHKTADNAVDFLHHHLLPRAGGVVIRCLLQDNGKEFTTHWPDGNHKFKQACKEKGIKQTFTRVKHPWTNGYVERLNQTILEEFYSVAFRKKVYTSLEELQEDLDQFMYRYNFQRAHQGYKLKENGYTTPAEAFFSGRGCLALPQAA